MVFGTQDRLFARDESVWNALEYTNLSYKLPGPCKVVDWPSFFPYDFSVGLRSRSKQTQSFLRESEQEKQGEFWIAALWEHARSDSGNGRLELLDSRRNRKEKHRQYTREHPEAGDTTPPLLRRRAQKNGERDQMARTTSLRIFSAVKWVQRSSKQTNFGLFTSGTSISNSGGSRFPVSEKTTEDSLGPNNESLPPRTGKGTTPMIAERQNRKDTTVSRHFSLSPKHNCNRFVRQNMDN